MQTATNIKQKNLYDNRMASVLAFFAIKRPDTVNIKSLRHQFLQKIAEQGFKSNFYVIEANRTGEVLQVRNFVVYPKYGGNADIDIYAYLSGRWIWLARARNIKTNIDDHFDKIYVPFAKGFNGDDIVVTKFEGRNVLYSEYFLLGTLSSASGVKEVIDTYDKKPLP